MKNKHTNKQTLCRLTTGQRQRTFLFVLITSRIDCICFSSCFCNHSSCPHVLLFWCCCLCFSNHSWSQVFFWFLVFGFGFSRHSWSQVLLCLFHEPTLLAACVCVFGSITHPPDRRCFRFYLCVSSHSSLPHVLLLLLLVTGAFCVWVHYTVLLAQFIIFFV